MLTTKSLQQTMTTVSDTIAMLQRENSELKQQLHDLREAVSPNRIAAPEYYIAVAKKMREGQSRIKFDWT